MEIESGELYECPYCHSDNICGDEVDFESWVRMVRCQDCKRHWQEYLKVYTVYIPLEYEEVYCDNNRSTE
jgi:DNA-directed RNA polymerase subunit RPC12/RpoP